ncbi:hypothetical protein KVT40_002814 [Elsinoe batatas]|uniref:Major facilitator superfamily (MFS) profile domain-containing protein n=1 Tax=Elsinoe batatas TaxID=2601811 RepID=A0A8K0PKK9_9PEZI|nr:hypothetical protein KVT40_002814 [Elsinoe batatas]
MDAGKTGSKWQWSSHDIQAARVVVGCWLTLFPAAGLLNSSGTLQAILLEGDLRSYTDSEVSWIISVYAWAYFFGGLLITGSIGVILASLSMSFCRAYYQYMLAFGVLGGFSSSCLYTTCVAVLAHWYDKRRALATALALTAGSIGGIAYPFMLSGLTPKIGLDWTFRATTLLTVVCLCLGIVLVRARLPPNSQARCIFDWRGFKDMRFTVTMLAFFFLEGAVLIPPAYITMYAISMGVERSMVDKLLPIMNATAVLGRVIPGLAADIFGRYNVTILCIVTCSALIPGLWLQADRNAASMAVFAGLYGFFSGPAYSLTPVCVSQLCRVEEYASKYGAAYGIVSLATLSGIPFSGLVLEARGERNYEHLILFCGATYVVASILFIVARALCCGWRFRTIF